MWGPCEAKHWDSYLPLPVAKVRCHFIVENEIAQVQSRGGQRDTKSL